MRRSQQLLIPDGPRCGGRGLSQHKVKAGDGSGGPQSFTFKNIWRGPETPGGSESTTGNHHTCTLINPSCFQDNTFSITPRLPAERTNSALFRPS